MCCPSCAGLSAVASKASGRAPKLDLREVSNLSSQRRQDLLELSCTVPLLLDHRRRGLGHKALVGERLLAAGELLLRRGDLLLKTRLLGRKIDLASSTTKTSTPLSTTAMLAAGFSTSVPMTSEAVLASGSMVERRLSSFSMSSTPARTTTSSSALGLKR